MTVMGIIFNGHEPIIIWVGFIMNWRIRSLRLTLMFGLMVIRSRPMIKIFYSGFSSIGAIFWLNKGRRMMP